MKRNRTGLIQKPLGVSEAPGKGMQAGGGRDTLPGPPPALQPQKQLTVNREPEEESTEEPEKEWPERFPDSRTAQVPRHVPLKSTVS